MTTQGFDHLYLETHNWGKSVAFWQALGYKLECETGHHSGQLVAPNGSRLFLAEQAPIDPVGMDVYLSAEQHEIDTADSIEVVFDWTDTHWGTQVLTVRDPDGRLFRVESPAAVAGGES